MRRSWEVMDRSIDVVIPVGCCAEQTIFNSMVIEPFGPSTVSIKKSAPSRLTVLRSVMPL